jgi:hypothetical protein
VTVSAAVYRSPSALLRELGVSEPQEINVEAIGQYCGATIVYEPLKGCEARVVGHADRAIITVDAGASRLRQRFSAGHELGHWMRDRGKVAFACTERMLNSEWTSDNPERRANEYAADLLMPGFMFVPRAKGREITFATVEHLAQQFETSMTATAIRLVQHGSFPAMLVFVANGERERFIRGCDVPEAIWPHKKPGKDTLAYDIMQGKPVVTRPREIYADSWVDHRDADRYGIVEDSIKIGPDQVLTLLWWKNERELIDLNEEEERRLARRSDWRSEEE